MTCFFKKNLKSCLLILIIFSSVVFYLYFGAANKVFIWQNNHRAKAYYEPLMSLLANKEIIAQDFLRLVKTRVRHYPQEAQGWYLLSKLELNVKNDIPSSYFAAKRAYKMIPDDLTVSSNYLEVFFLYHPKFSLVKMKELIKKVQRLDSNNEIALNLAGLLAYQQHNYILAIKDWSLLLSHENLSSPQKNIFKRLIKKASHELLKKYPMKVILDYQISKKYGRLLKNKKFIYVSVKLLNKLRPLWVDKHKLTNKNILNNQLVLTASNAMVDSLQLPLGQRLMIEIRFSEHKNVLVNQGDFYGKQEIYLKSRKTLHRNILINKKFT